MLHRSNPIGDERRGMVLLAVLVIVVLLSLAAYQYSDLMLSEYKAVVNAHTAAQARAWADSGIHYAAAFIRDPNNIAGLNGNIFDNPDKFAHIAVGDDGKMQGRFSLIAPPDADGGSTSWRFGFSDEAGKINVNAFMKRDPSGKELYDALLKLPNVTQEVAASIVDWIDADSESRQEGAEDDYYSSAQLPYRCKNGPIDTIGELLLVKGVDRGVLYGNDLNGNGIQDPDESADPTLGFTRGLSAYLTVNSRETNTDKQGQALSYVNESDLQAYYEKVASGVSEDMAKFLIMYRQYGAANSSGQQQSMSATINALTGALSITSKTTKTSTAKTIKGNLSAWTPDFTKKANQKISSFYDLVDAQVSIPGKAAPDAKGKNTQPPATVYDSPLKDKSQRRELFTKLFENMTIFAEADIPARININTAPREVLLAIPGIAETDVEAILANRPVYSATSAPDPVYETPAWLLTEANLKTDTLKKLEKYVTTKSQMYRVQALGYSDKGTGPTARIEAVIDTNFGRPRIVMWRDLTELGSTKMLQP